MQQGSVMNWKITPQAIKKTMYALLVLFSNTAQCEWFSDTQDIMGTVAYVELWSESSEQASKAIREAMDELKRIDKLMSPYDTASELYKINHQAVFSPVVISVELFTLIEKSLYYSRLSGGAFDISFSSVGRFYSYPKSQAPSAQKIAHLLTSINYKKIILDKKTNTLFLQDPEMALDLGGIAKGYAVDNAVERLKLLGITSAIVSAGGDSRILGDRSGRPWLIGIQHPRIKGQHALRIPLSDTAISTSGDYERFFIQDGVRVHHILDPISGRSAHDVQSVSILAPLAVDSDALSTTVFVLGVKKGLQLINRLQGVDAIIIDGKGLLHYSDDLIMPKQ